MSTILDTIIEQKHSEVQLLKKQHKHLKPSASKKRPFLESLKVADGLGIIAEVKKASPSKGIICNDFDPVKIATKYEQGGARAISVLTDEKFFQGNLSYLEDIREVVKLPILRKDFIIDIVQVEQTAHIGADAMLLIVAALDNYQLLDLYQAARALSIQPLIEIHDTVELDRAMKIEPDLIGINNRNLKTFVTDLSISTSLVKILPANVCVVSESGIEKEEQALTLKKAGVKALLVGESLMIKDDPAPLIKELMCEGVV